MIFRSTTRRAFTLIEVMIVLMIVGIVASAGIPMIWKAMEKDQMAKAMHDVLEGAKLARDRAILHNRPFDFVIKVHAENEVEMDVESAKIKDPSGLAFAGSDQTFKEPGSLMGKFPRKLGSDVIVRMVDINFIDHMQAGEARVRFFPNGTCDEFSLILEHHSLQRQIRADIITGSVFEVVK
jgi:prepilin-type N-terminal cleavage/methylation domain-containing protein